MGCCNNPESQPDNPFDFKRTTSLALTKRPSQLAIGPKLSDGVLSGDSSEEEVKPQTSRLKKQPSEVGASLVSSAFGHHIDTLIQQNADIADELNQLAKGGLEGALMEEILEEAFNKTHEEEGKELKRLVVKKDKFLEITEDFKQDGLSKETIESIEPLVALSLDDTEHYQVKLLEAVLAAVQKKYAH